LFHETGNKRGEVGGLFANMIIHFLQFYNSSVTLTLYTLASSAFRCHSQSHQNMNMNVYFIFLKYMYFYISTD